MVYKRLRVMRVVNSLKLPSSSSSVGEANKSDTNRK